MDLDPLLLSRIAVRLGVGGASRIFKSKANFARANEPRLVKHLPLKTASRQTQLLFTQIVEYWDWNRAVRRATRKTGYLISPSSRQYLRSGAPSRPISIPHTRDRTSSAAITRARG
jgi:hypothetical protein